MDLTAQAIHRELMQAICEIINTENKPLVLKGGTALLLAYGLDRFSEDLDFDLTKTIRSHINVKSICMTAAEKLAEQGTQLGLLDFKELKKTQTTHRCRALFSFDDGAALIPLKIELSSRRLPDAAVQDEINGIKVYKVNEIAKLKLLAAQENDENHYRTAARDLHDLAFIANQWEAELT